MPQARNHDRRRYWRQPGIRFGLAMLFVLAFFGVWLASVFG